MFLNFDKRKMTGKNECVTKKTILPTCKNDLFKTLKKSIYQRIVMAVLEPMKFCFCKKFTFISKK